MSYRIILSSLFNYDLEKIVSYYYELNISTAKKYYNNIFTAIKKLEKYPMIGRIVPECEDVFYDKYRELIYENYRIIYRLEENKIMILRILDGRMKLNFNFIE